MKAKILLQLTLAPCVLLALSFKPVAQEVDDVVNNPDVALETDRVEKQINFSVREAMNWERQARQFELENKTDKANDAWREAFARYESMWRDYLGPEKPTEKEPLVRTIHLPPASGRDKPEPQYLEPWIPLPDFINQRLRVFDWPKMFKDRVAMRQSGPGQQMLNKALDNNDMKLMRRCARYYQFSPAGAKALRLLADVALERGDSLLAARWLVELGYAHPQEFRRDPSIWVSYVRAFRESDSRYLLEKALRDLERNSKDAMIDVGGKKVNLLEHARELAAAPIPGERAELHRFGWPTLLGRASHDRVGPPIENVGEMLDFNPTAGVQGYQLTTKQADNRNEDRYYYGNQPAKTRCLNFPVVHQSGFYLHQIASQANNSGNAAIRAEQLLGFAHGNEARPQAMTIKSGAEYPQPKDDNRGNRYWYYERQQRDRNRILASTIGRLTWAVEPRESEVLFAVIGQGNPSSDENASRTGNQIQAFDLTTEGKHLVTLPNERVENVEDWRFLQRIVFNGAPIVRDNRLYVTGTLARRGSTEAWAFCFDVTPRGDSSRGEGKLQWKTMICAKKAAGNMGWGDDPTPESVEVASLAEQGGMLFASTQMGACAGLDRETGEICWVAKYDRPGVQQAIGWQGNAPIAAGGLVVIAPDDSNFAFVIDGIYGTKLFEHPLKGRGAAGEMQYLLGVIDNHMIIQGKRKLYSVALTTYRMGGKGNASNWGGLKYETAMFESQTCGRGIIAGDKVLVPLKDSIAFYDVNNGKLTTKFLLPEAVERGEDLYTLTVYCRGEAEKDKDGNIKGYKAVTLKDPKTGAIYDAEHLRNGDKFTFPDSGATAVVNKETFLIMASSKWMYLFSATDK